jgi:hypothetical protein
MRKTGMESLCSLDSDHHINHRNTSDLPPLQLSQEQRELGGHVDGSGGRRLPGPAQSTTRRNDRVWVRWGQGWERWIEPAADDLYDKPAYRWRA